MIIIDLMNMAALDLNLLRVLDAILREGRTSTTSGYQSDEPNNNASGSPVYMAAFDGGS